MGQIEPIGKPTAEAPPVIDSELVEGSPADAQEAFFHPLFAGTGGIDSWLTGNYPESVRERLSTLPQDPLTRSQLCQLLILSHEAGLSEGFFRYYWLTVPEHAYDVRNIKPFDSFDSSWASATAITSLAHLRWGLSRFYVDALLYFGNVRSAYRHLRAMTVEEITQEFRRRRFDTKKLMERGPSLPLAKIAKDDRYLVAEYACKSLDSQSGDSELRKAALAAYRNHTANGGSAVVSVDELLRGEFIDQKWAGRQEQLLLSADDILKETVSSEEELESRLTRIEEKFQKAREAAVRNTALYLSMVEELDVYVATSMRSRENFRTMGTFCEKVFGSSELTGLNVRFFDPTLSAADGHVDKGLIECLMVDAAKILVYYAGPSASLGKDFEAAMALSRGKPVIIYADTPQLEYFYRDVHPLTRLIEFDTGVAIGAMVTRDVEQVGVLIGRILKNAMEYEIRQTENRALQLHETLTGSLVRLQTGDRLLQETFWNYYHHRGKMP